MVKFRYQMNIKIPVNLQSIQIQPHSDFPTQAMNQMIVKSHQKSSNILPIKWYQSNYQNNQVVKVKFPNEPWKTVTVLGMAENSRRKFNWVSVS